MIDTDEGARRLGEVALVPHSSPIASSGLLFLNTLFDENAASHIALGQAYSTCLKNGDQLTPEELAARGANDSLIHVDWMIGSGEIDLDGITADRHSRAADAQRRMGLTPRPRGPSAKRQPSPGGLGNNPENDPSAVGAALW